MREDESGVHIEAVFGDVEAGGRCRVQSFDPDCFFGEASLGVGHMFDGKKRERRNVTIIKMVTDRGLTLVFNVT